MLLVQVYTCFHSFPKDTVVIKRPKAEIKPLLKALKRSSATCWCQWVQCCCAFLETSSLRLGWNLAGLCRKPSSAQFRA